MGDFTVIGDVSSILARRLEAAVLKVTPNGAVRLWDPADDTNRPVEPLLTVFLYEIAEDAASRNRPFTRTEPVLRGEPARNRKPPMALSLRYLITAWNGDPVTQHRMLGCALQTLYDDAIFDGTELIGSLAGSADTMAVTLTQLTLDQKSYVWFALQKPFRLSLNYEVRVVNLESTVETAAAPVTSRTLVTGVTDPAPVGGVSGLVRPR
ncbi:hypothetical protein J2S43_001712 [Catenuloplanes nepalensis]|uniref:Pvc16 N-terminal domain-containing protein n=1 Tax=Catenuloplanes nepalensis TaxID=587533 RepID=A0ABT9MP53_9ACTN|nr:DUF4255 domain-containing protein [Catenuloplanes nepalensis]MDP9793200.1 hypothetical protein [Catenuloplanes nepalensis]